MSASATLTMNRPATDIARDELLALLPAGSVVSLWEHDAARIRVLFRGANLSQPVAAVLGWRFVSTYTDRFGSDYLVVPGHLADAQQATFEALSMALYGNSTTLDYLARP